VLPGNPNRIPDKEQGLSTVGVAGIRPPEEPAGNERTAWRTSDSETDRAESRSGAGRAPVSPDVAGCLSCLKRRFFSDGVTGESSEFKSLIAARRFPCSSLAATASANSADEGFDCFLGELAGLDESETPGEKRPIRVFIIVARL